MSLLFLRALPLITTTSLVIFESLLGLMIVTSSRLDQLFVANASTLTIASPEISSETSTTETFCFPEVLKITHLLNFFSPLSSALNEIDFPGIGTVSQKFSGTNIIDPRYHVTTCLSLSIARTVTSMASLTLDDAGAMISNCTTAHSA